MTKHEVFYNAENAMTPECRVCGLRGETITTECPGKPIDECTLDDEPIEVFHIGLIYNGFLDFRGGEWREQSAPHRRGFNPQDEGVQL